MATIQNKTARRMMYDWHGGSGSPFYQAASSGLVASFTALALECDSMEDPKERSKLLAWIQKRQANKTRVVVQGQEYAVLPWVSRSYFGNTEGKK